MNPVFEWAKTFHALDRAAIVIGDLTLTAANDTAVEEQYNFIFFFSFLRCGETESTWYVGPLTGPLYQRGAVGGTRIGKKNRSTRRKPTPAPLSPPQIPHDLSWDRTRAAAVGSQRLNAWAMAWPNFKLLQQMTAENVYVLFLDTVWHSWRYIMHHSRQSKDELYSIFWR
jgi:hypothetical protein